MSRAVWVAALVMVGSFTGNAQSPSARYSISGVVQDQAGATIVGARVELGVASNPRGQSTVTDQSGSFQFKRIAAGNYQLHVSSEGFESTALDVTVSSQSPAPLQVVMAIASIHQETTVTSEPAKISTEASDNKDTVALSEESLSNLPVFDQDYIGAMSRFLDPASVGTSGVTLIVNGMEVNNLGVSPTAIKEIKINQDPYSAEYARPGRGRIEVTTKPGSPEYHGTFNFIFRDAHLNARDAFALTRPPEQRRIYEGIFTSPILGSAKTTFLLSVNRNEENLEAVVFALTPSGGIQENVSTPARNLLVSGKINHVFSDTHNFSFFYSYEKRSNHNQGVGGIVLPEAGSDSEQTENEIRINDQYFISPKLLNQFRFLLGHYHAPTRNISGDPRIVVPDTFIGGSAQADQLRTESHFELTDIVAYTSGRNTIKVGIDIPDYSRRGLDNNINQGGTFYFSSLQDYIARRPFSFQQQQGNGHMVFYERIIDGFAQDDIRLRPNLMISAGLRYDWQNYFHDNNNFAPRFSFAYSPKAGGNTVFRGGAGVFYDRTGPRPIFDILLFNGELLKLYVF